MKFKDIARIGINKANNQYSFNLRAKQLKKLGLTPEILLDAKIIKPKSKPIEFKKEVKIVYGRNKK